jgi:hypothetical protein
MFQLHGPADFSISLEFPSRSGRALDASERPVEASMTLYGPQHL